MSKSGGTTIALLIIPLFIGGCSGNLIVSAVQIHLVAGWMKFLAVTLPHVTIDAKALVTAVLCLAALALGGHRFLTWLYAATCHGESPREASSPPRRWRVRWTAYLLTLVIVAFTAGISAVGIIHQTSWLAGGR